MPTPTVPSNFRLRPDVAQALDDLVRDRIAANKSAAVNAAIVTYVHNMRRARQGSDPQR